MSNKLCIKTDDMKIAAVFWGKKTLKIIGWIVMFCVALAIFGYVSRYIEDRNLKKAHTEEFFRRNAMTSEARIAEDSAKAKAAAEKITNDRNVRITELGKQACLAYWMRSLKDPESAHLEGYEHSINSNGDYSAEIHSRSKNSFGGYVRNTFYCLAAPDGSSVKVTDFITSKY